LKRAVTLYLDSEVVDVLKKRGVSISSLVDTFLRKVMEEQLLASEYFADLSPYYDERDTLKSKIEVLESQLARLQKRLSVVESFIRRGEVVIAEAEKAKQSAMLFKEMNQVIVSCNFKADMAWELCKGIVKELASLGQEIDKEWFEQHVRSLKTWLS